MRSQPSPYFVGPPDRRAPWKKTAGRRARWLRKFVLFVVACIATYGLEHMAIHYLAHSEGAAATLSQSLFGGRELYRSAVAAWPRRLVPRYTALVYIDPQADPTADGLAGNICEQRDYLAQLLPAIVERQPALIVIDRSFSRAPCRSNDPTPRLQAAIAQASARLPVVLGLYIEKEEAGGSEAGVPVRSVLKTMALPVAPLLREGIMNLDTDTTRIALGWTVRREEGGAPAWVDGLALAAAGAYDPLLFEKYPRLRALVAARSNPYMSLIEPRDLVVFQGGDLLCALAAPTARMQPPCAERRVSAVDVDYLRGRIVIVGERSPTLDRHRSVIGEGGDVQGMDLQANALEALLDQRYFAPVPTWINYLVGFLFFVAIEAALVSAGGVVRTLLWIAAAAAVTFLLMSLTVRYLGFYVNPVTVSLPVLIVKLLGWFGELTYSFVGGGHHEA
jgi:hypothetical protein